ncbi:MAG: arsenite methyltransferase [Candidatus Bipolaricaulota bacterium]
MEDKHELVRKRYAEVARRGSSCCGASADCCESGAQLAGTAHPVPEAELGLSCGAPLAHGHVRPGDTVVDLGCGAGVDVFLAAQIAGPTGRAIGVDMTEEMLDRARANAEQFAARTDLANVEFRQGQIEVLPLEDQSADVIISNCVVNLSPDKPRVFGEAYRVLRPGGRLVVSDLVLSRPLPEAAREDPDLYAACIAGAALRDDYLGAIRDAGFSRVEVLDERSDRDNSCAPESADGDPYWRSAVLSITVLAIK